jgi:ABC-type transport system substrate-binding protein
VKGGFLLEQKQTIAIVVIIVVIAGAVAGYMIMFPAIPPGGTILMGTTDSVEASIDMAQSYDYFGWEIITALSSGLVEIEPGSAGGADDIMPALAESWLATEGGTQWDFNLREGSLAPVYKNLMARNGTWVMLTSSTMLK